MRLSYITGETDANIGLASEIEIDLDTMGRGVTIEIVRVMVKHISGSARHFHMSIGNAAGYTNETVSNLYLNGPVNVSNLLDEPLSNSTTKCGFGHTSSSGKLYIRFAPNTGSNNKFSYAIYYKV